MRDLELFKKEISRNSITTKINGEFPITSVVKEKDVMDLIEELEQSELPEAPGWFDEWMSDGGSEKSLFGAFNELYEHHEFKMQVWANSLQMGHAELQQVIAVILKGGLSSYTVEVEKYYVVNKSNESLLMRVTDAEYTDKVAYSHVRLLSHIFDHAEEGLYQFTEQEIKDYEKRYWPFAVPVEHIERKVKNGKI